MNSSVETGHNSKTNTWNKIQIKSIQDFLFNNLSIPFKNLIEYSESSEIFTEILNKTKKLLIHENPNERRTTVEHLTQQPQQPELHQSLIVGSQVTSVC